MLSALFSFAALAAAAVTLPDAITGAPVELFGSQSHAFVALFVRTDCPITNRYAPELAQIAKEFQSAGVEFWLIYPDRSETADSITRHAESYHLPGRALRDLNHYLARLAHATVSPESAVFNGKGILLYHGRIDDRYISLGRSRPGGARTHDLKDAIAATLAGKPVQQRETRAFGCFLSDVE